MRLSSVFLLTTALFAQTPHEWVARSNQNAALLIDVGAKYGPEGAAAQGVSGLDDKITVPTIENEHRRRADLVRVQQELRNRLAAEKDALVKQDLEILISAAGRSIRNIDETEKTFLD